MVCCLSSLTTNVKKGPSFALVGWGAIGVAAMAAGFLGDDKLRCCFKKASWDGMLPSVMAHCDSC
jgi:hypothetical protein